MEPDNDSIRDNGEDPINSEPSTSSDNGTQAIEGGLHFNMEEGILDNLFPINGYGISPSWIVPVEMEQTGKRVVVRTEPEDSGNYGRDVVNLRIGGIGAPIPSTSAVNAPKTSQEPTKTAFSIKQEPSEPNPSTSANVADTLQEPIRTAFPIKQEPSDTNDNSNGLNILMVVGPSSQEDQHTALEEESEMVEYETPLFPDKEEMEDSLIVNALETLDEPTQTAFSIKQEPKDTPEEGPNGLNDSMVVGPSSQEVFPDPPTADSEENAKFEEMIFPEKEELEDSMNHDEDANFSMADYTPPGEEEHLNEDVGRMELANLTHNVHPPLESDKMKAQEMYDELGFKFKKEPEFITNITEKYIDLEEEDGSEDPIEPTPRKDDEPEREKDLKEKKDEDKQAKPEASPTKRGKKRKVVIRKSTVAGQPGSIQVIAAVTPVKKPRLDSVRMDENSTMRDVLTSPALCLLTPRRTTCSFGQVKIALWIDPKLADKVHTPSIAKPFYFCTIDETWPQFRCSAVVYITADHNKMYRKGIPKDIPFAFIVVRPNEKPDYRLPRKKENRPEQRLKEAIDFDSIVV